MTNNDELDGGPKAIVALGLLVAGGIAPTLTWLNPIETALLALLGIVLVWVALGALEAHDRWLAPRRSA